MSFKAKLIEAFVVGAIAEGIHGDIPKEGNVSALKQSVNSFTRSEWRR